MNAQLVKDINPNNSNGSNPTSLTEFDGQLFFTANDGVTGSELWISDGTANGTQLLKDIDTTDNPYGPSGSYASDFTEFDGQLFFTADDGITGQELWVSDGTADGTQLLKDINPGSYDVDIDYPASSYASDFTEFDGQLFFSANDGVTGNELWVSDGTANGTQLLKDINTTDNPYGPSSSLPSNFTEFDGQLFFTANDGVTGSELWISDGTANGTQLLKDIDTTDNPYGPSGSYASDFTEFDGQLFFTADDGITGRELWVSDGTANGTQLLKDINTTDSPYGPGPFSFTEFDGQLFFTADDGVTGRELWVSDGTANGTQLLKDINTTDSPYGSSSSDASDFTEVDDKLFFTADDGVTGRELWVSDGTANGTQLLVDINNDIFSNPPQNLTTAGDLLFFITDDGFTGTELWISDGTAEGTQLFQDINPDTDGLGPDSLTVVDDQLFFSANDGTTGRELWVATIPDNIISGDENDNVINGTRGVDLINGLGGDDIIRGRRGNDILSGGSGDDILFGNRGNDTIRGGDGNDRIFGKKGNDDLQGGAGDDVLKGGARHDILSGDAGNDVLRGGNGQDHLTGGAGQDRLFGGQGADTLTGGTDNDVLRGNNGADTFLFEVDLLDGVADTDTIQRFQSQDILDFSAYLEAGSSIDTTRVTSRLLRVDLGGEDIVNIFGNSNALDVAQSQL